MKKQYYFIRKTDKAGRNYFLNQDGKRVSKAKVESGKRKIYDYAKRTIPYTNIEKGDLIDRVKAKSKTRKQVEFKGSELEIISPVIQREISTRINEGFSIFFKTGGKTYQAVSDQAKANLLLFNYELQEKFYKFVKKRKTASPLFLMKLKVNEKDEIILFDFDSMELDEDMKGARGIKKEFNSFTDQVQQLRNKYFNK